jgi:hypothetical protein
MLTFATGVHESIQSSQPIQPGDVACVSIVEFPTNFQIGRGECDADVQ